MRRLIASILMVTATLACLAQCPIENKAFKGGETLDYDLYFNWKFVWVKVGTAQMATKSAVYNGEKAYKAHLITRGNSKLDKFFVMRDTLLCYTTEDIVPLYFRKGAEEGKRYYVDELWYSYPNGDCKLKQHYMNAKGEHKWKETTHHQCVYDMMSIFLRARNYDASKMKKGDSFPLPISDANDLSDCRLVYLGAEKYRRDKKHKEYDCLMFSFREKEKGKEKEIIRFWVTNDKSHTPVRLDMFLNFGSAKAFLK